MISEGRVGPIIASEGSVNDLRMDKVGCLVSTQGHGTYVEAALRKKIFYAASQAATTWSVALNATHTGFVLNNPVGSPVNLSILQVSFALSVAPVAIAHVGLFAGFLSTGIVTHTTPLTPARTFIGQTAGYGLADGAATLVGTPVWVMPFLGGFTAGALFGTTPSVIDLGGSFIVPPGGYIGIGALTAVVGFAGMTWEEIDI